MGRKTTTHVLNNLYSEETNLINDLNTELSLVATHTPDCHCQNTTVNNKEPSTKCSLLNRKIHFTDLRSLVVNCQFDCQFKHCLISTKNVSVLLILCTVSGEIQVHKKMMKNILIIPVSLKIRECDPDVQWYIFIYFTRRSIYYRGTSR